MSENRMPQTYSKVYQAANFEILKSGRVYYIKVYSSGVSMSQINQAIEKNELIITDFLNIKDAMTRKFNEILPFASKKEKIVISISNNDLMAYTKLFLTEEELREKDKIVDEINSLLVEKGIVYGIRLEQIRLAESLPAQKNIVIAQGMPPTDGKDSTIKKYEYIDSKPKKKLDGSVDHLNSGIINQVNKGQWLGEWTKPGKGIEGISVKGQKLKANEGKLITIPYHEERIQEYDDGNIVTLKSKVNGALKIDQNGVLDIESNIIIENVDYSTGNIDFNGSVTITGTVSDGFSVIANDDIQILGLDGIGCVGEIISRKGNVHISGGINGKGKSIIKAVSINSKYISNANIYAKDSVKVSEYILNSHVEASEVFTEKLNSYVAGCTLKNLSNMVTGSLGNEIEAKTTIEFKEIDRVAIANTQRVILEKIDEIKDKIAKLNIQIENGGASFKRGEAIWAKGEFFHLQQILELEYHKLNRMLAIKGNGSIVVKNFVYPGVRIISLDTSINIWKKKLACTIYCKNGKIGID